MTRAARDPALAEGRRLGPLHTARESFAPDDGLFAGSRDFNFRPKLVFRTMSLQLQGGLGTSEVWELGRLCGAYAARWGLDAV